MTAEARTARPGVIVVSTGRCGSTMLSNMLRLNPEILSLSEFFSLLMPDPFPAGELDAAAYWRILHREHSTIGTLSMFGPRPSVVVSPQADATTSAMTRERLRPTRSR